MAVDQLSLFSAAGSVRQPTSSGEHSSKRLRRLCVDTWLSGDMFNQLMDQLQLHARQYDPQAHVTELPVEQQPPAGVCVGGVSGRMGTRPPAQQRWVDLPFVCVDCETTGLDPQQNRIIEVAWVTLQGQRVLGSESRLCGIEEPLPEVTTQITGITQEMLAGKPPFVDHVDALLEAVKQAEFVVAYNADFDKRFLQAECARSGKTFPDKPWVDPYIFIREIDRYKRSKRLADAAARWGVVLEQAHRAESDAVAAAQLLIKLSERISCNSLADLVKRQADLKREQEIGFREYLTRKQAQEQQVALEK
ncbi:MAG: 3'-5' exonuclease [Myxococcota bacterium]